MTEVNDDPKPVDYLFAALAVILLVLGVVLMVATSVPEAAPRLPIVPPGQLISYGVTREG